MNIEKIEKNAEHVTNLNIKQISAKTRQENMEKNVERIRSIMFEGALNQFNFENCSDAREEKVVKLENKDKIEFFDF